jgi:hypothetical protein
MEYPTLYQKLKPEVKGRLYSQDRDYEDTVNYIVKILKSKLFYTELKISEVQSLQIFSDTRAKTTREFNWGTHLFDDLYDDQ